MVTTGKHTACRQSRALQRSSMAGGSGGDDGTAFYKQLTEAHLKVAEAYPTTVMLLSGGSLTLSVNFWERSSAPSRSAQSGRFAWAGSLPACRAAGGLSSIHVDPGDSMDGLIGGLEVTVHERRIGRPLQDVPGH
jgi:hypothetical protein